MDKNKLENINKKIDKLKVLGYDEAEVLSDSSFIKIVRGEYRLNNNKSFNREIIVSGRDSNDAVCVFAIDKDDNVLIVIQPRVAIDNINKINVEIPAGYVDNNESLEHAALRELREETGYVTDNLMYIDSYYPSVGASTQKIHIYMALDCEKKYKQKLDKDEFVEYEVISLEEFDYLLNNNYILDVNAKFAYYRVLDYLTEYKLKKIVSKLISDNKTISTMESCTGGFIASNITNIEDSSKILKYSAVTYSNEYKIKMGVDSEVIDKYSVYSKECAEDMAYNISNYANSSYGVGVTGTLKKYDDNNITKDNDIVYICIYDKDNNKYYDYKYRVYSNKRINNKKFILNHILNDLNKIIY